MKKFIDFFTKTQTGRALAIAAVVLALAYGGKQYYTHTNESQRTRDARDANGTLTTMADSLEAHLEDSDDAELDDLPAHSGWFPERLDCGADSSFPEPDGVWSWMGIEAGEATRFQFRVERIDEGFRLRARRDSDCDGLYYVITQDSRESMTGGFYRRTESQNVNE